MRQITFTPLVPEKAPVLLSKPEKAFCKLCEGGNCDECLYHPVNMAAAIADREAMEALEAFPA